MKEIFEFRSCIEILANDIKVDTANGGSKNRNSRNPQNPPKFTKSSVYIKQIPPSATKSTSLRLYEAKIV